MATWKKLVQFNSGDTVTVATPTANGHAATKAYVDNATTGIVWSRSGSVLSPNDTDDELKIFQSMQFSGWNTHNIAFGSVNTGFSATNTGAQIEVPLHATNSKAHGSFKFYTNSGDIRNLALTLEESGNATFGGIITTGVQHDALIVNAPANGNAQIKFQDNGTDKWKIGKQGSAMGFALYNSGTDSNAIAVDVSNNNATFAGEITASKKVSITAEASAYGLQLTSGSSGATAPFYISHGGGSHTGGAIKIYSANSGNLLTANASAGSGSFNIESLYNNGKPNIVSTGGATFDENVTSAKNFLISADSTGSDQRVKLGASADLQLWHNGADSVVGNMNTGKLYLYNYNDGDTVIGSWDNAEITVGDGLTTFDGGIKVLGGGIKLATDTKRYMAGAGDDLQIYHNGTDSYIDNQTGHLRINNAVDGGTIRFQTDDTSGQGTTPLVLEHNLATFNNKIVSQPASGTDATLHLDASGTGNAQVWIDAGTSTRHPELSFRHDGSNYWTVKSDPDRSNDFCLRDDQNSAAIQLRIAQSTGNATFAGNVTAPTLTSKITSNNTGIEILFNADTGYKNNITGNFDGSSASASNMTFKVASGSGSQVTPLILKGDSSATFAGNIIGSGRLQIANNLDATFGTELFNSHATGHGVKIRGGSTSSQYALYVSDHDQDNTLFQVLGNGDSHFTGKLGVGGVPSDEFTIHSSSGSNKFHISADGSNWNLRKQASGGSSNDVIYGTWDSTNVYTAGWLYVNNRIMGASGDVRVGSNDGNEMLHLLADGTAKIDTAGTTALTIDSSQNATFAGKVGMGNAGITSSFEFPLNIDINSSTNQQCGLEVRQHTSGNDARIRFKNADSKYARLGMSSNGDFFIEPFDGSYNKRFTMDNDGKTTITSSIPTGLTVDVGLPSSANREIARFTAASARPIAFGWIDSGSKLSLYTPDNHSLVLGTGALGTNNLELTDAGTAILNTNQGSSIMWFKHQGTANGAVYGTGTSFGLLDEGGNWFYKHTNDTKHEWFDADTIRMTLTGNNLNVEGSVTCSSLNVDGAVDFDLGGTSHLNFGADTNGVHMYVGSNQFFRILGNAGSNEIVRFNNSGAILETDTSDATKHLLLKGSNSSSSGIDDFAYSNIVCDAPSTGSVAIALNCGSNPSNAGYIMFGTATSNTDGYIKHQTNGVMVIRNDGATSMECSDANVVSGDFNDTSDIALKKDISTLSSGLNFIKQLRPVNFKWRKGDRDSSGFIAQEVATVMPENVQGDDYAPSFFTEDGIEIDGSQGKSVNTIGLVAYLTKAVQELSAELDTLKNG